MATKARRVGLPPAMSGLAARLAEIPMLSSEEERAMAAACAAGDAAARRKLIESHLRIALSLARSRARSPSEVEDLFQTASTAIVRAADRFDPSRGARFSFVAKLYAKEAMNDAAMAAASLVRIPDSDAYKRAFRLLSRQPGDRRERAESVACETGMPIAKVETLAAAMGGATPIESDSVAVADAERPDVAAEAADESRWRRGRMAEAMRSLSPVEADIVASRDMAEAPQTYGEIAGRHPFGQERARQIHHAALAKLRKEAARA